jgi:hypothetical protein
MTSVRRSHAQREQGVGDDAHETRTQLPRVVPGGCSFVAGDRRSDGSLIPSFETRKGDRYHQRNVVFAAAVDNRSARPCATC